MSLLNKRVVNLIIKNKIKLAIAESCTGGLLSAAITSVKGSSKIFNVGLVTYSNKSKVKLLKISKKIIQKHGAVSEQVCKAMVKNVDKIFKTNISVAVTGIAGPGGGTKEKPVGLIYIGVKKGNKIITTKMLLKNKGRSYIQNKTVKKSLELILKILR